MQKTFFILILVWVPHYFFAQDSLSTLENDTLRIKKHLQSATQARSTQYEEARENASSALFLAKHHELKHWMAKSHAILGGILSLGATEEDVIMSIKHTEEALELFRELGDSIRVQRCYINLSNSYTSLNKYPEALKTGNETLRLAWYSFQRDQTRKNIEALGNAYGTLARVYSGLQLSDSALANYRRAYSYFEQADSPIRFIVALNSADILHSKKAYNKALYEYKKAYEGGKTVNYYKIVSNAGIGIGKVKSQHEDYLEAQSYFLEALALAEQYSLADVQSLASYHLAKSYKELSNPDSAMYWIDKALTASDSIVQLGTQIAILKLKAELLELKGEASDALTYFRTAERLEDTLLARQNVPTSTQVLIEQQSQSHQARERDFEHILNRKKMGLLLTLAIILALGVLGYFAFRSQRKKLTEIQETQVQLKEKHEREEEEKSRVSRKLVSITANLALQNELLSKTNKLLDQIQKKIELQNLEDEVEATQQQIKARLDLDKMWEEFFIHFEEVNPRFLERLREKYDLTQNELKLCAFTKINLSYKEIARLMNVNHNSINVSMFRLKKKLGLPKDISAAEFLQSRFN